jgi:hypothetical protein
MFRSPLDSDRREDRKMDGIFHLETGCAFVLSHESIQDGISNERMLRTNKE